MSPAPTAIEAIATLAVLLVHEGITAPGRGRWTTRSWRWAARCAPIRSQTPSAQ